MNICVFGAASIDIDKKYIEAVESMGRHLAKRGHDLVFGAGCTGLMGAAARGFKSEGGYIRGVIPEFFKEEMIELIYTKCDELIYTESMRERKAKMEDYADAFIITPGGIGTFEEFFEVLTLKQLGRHKKPIAIYNIDGYYNSMNNMIEHSINQKFIKNDCRALYKCFNDLDKLTKYIEEDNIDSLTVKDLK